MKLLRNIRFPHYKIRIIFLSLLLALNVGSLTYWAVLAAGDGRFFLLHEDEVIYYGSAQLFADTNSVRAESCIEEKVSPVGMMNWYGPGYNISYGILFKLFGSHPAAFPWFHYGLSLAILLAVFIFPFSIEQRLILASGIGFSQQLGIYIFTFFPEALILFLATILTLLLAFTYAHKDWRIKRILIFVFIVSVFVLMLWRVTFIFWLAGLVGISKEKKHIMSFVALFIIGVAISLLYMKFFLAPPWASSMHKIDHLYSFNLFDFAKETLKTILGNLKNFILPAKSIVRFMLALFVLATITAVISKRRMLFAILLVGCTLLAVMAAYYAIDDFYFIKQSAMLLPLFMFGILASTTNKIIHYIVLALPLTIFPSTVKRVNAAIEERRSAYNHYENSAEFALAFLDIRRFVEDKPLVILWDYREYDYGYCTQALLPYSTQAKEPIMYTTNIVDASATAQERFRTHGRLKIDYVLSRYELQADTLKEVHVNKFYHLYKSVGAK